MSFVWGGPTFSVKLGPGPGFSGGSKYSVTPGRGIGSCWCWGRAPPFLGRISFISMQFSTNILLNNRFWPSPQGLSPTIWKSWIRHCCSIVSVFHACKLFQYDNLFSFCPRKFWECDNRYFVVTHVASSVKQHSIVMVIVFGSLPHEDEIIAFDVFVSLICLIERTGCMTVLLIEFFFQNLIVYEIFIFRQMMIWFSKSWLNT